jgi:hypothetical protein
VPAAPALFAHVPADTPYLFGMLAPAPPAYAAWIGKAFSGGEIDGLIDRLLQTPPATDGERVVHAVLRAARGNLDAAGMRKLTGIATDARGAFYGLGLIPVFRVELADPAALPATLDRIAKEAGVTLPVATLKDRPYWRFESDGFLAVVAIADGQLVASMGPADLVTGALPHVLGLEKPAAAMADGAALRSVIAAHGFGPWAGYLDVQRLVALLGTSAGVAQRGPACAAALAAAARRFPRLSVGYDEWSAKTITGRMVLETDPAIAQRLAGLAVEVPGLPSGPLPGHPLFAIGAGVNLEAGRLLASDFLGGVALLATACDAADAASGARELAGPLAQPLPPFLAQVRGLVVSLIDVSLAGGAPTGVEGYALLVADDPGALLGELLKAAPIPGLAELPRDGSFHDLTAPGLGTIQVAVKPRLIAAAAGARGRAAADAAIAGRPGKAPLFLFSYDYGRLMKLLLAKMPQSDQPEQALARRIVEMLGTVALWAHPSDKGLVLAMSMELN